MTLQKTAALRRFARALFLMLILTGVSVGQEISGTNSSNTPKFVGPVKYDRFGAGLDRSSKAFAVDSDRAERFERPSPELKLELLAAEKFLPRKRTALVSSIEKDDEPFIYLPIAEGAAEIEKAGRAAMRGRSSGRWVIPDGATEYGVEFGFAPGIATWMSGPKYYDIEDRGHILGAVRWGKILGTRAFVTYSWAVEIIPINVALNNEVDNPRYLEGSVGEPPRNREHTWGVGINPASFRFIFFPQYRLRPQLGAGFGVVRHHSRVPTVEGTKMNFQVDFQIGGQYMLKENNALNFGYRYYHFSNLYLFNFNPGYNVNMFFVGYSVFK